MRTGKNRKMKKLAGKGLKWLTIMLLLVFGCFASGLAEESVEGGEWVVPPTEEAELKELAENEPAESNAGTVEILDPDSMEKLLEEEGSEEPWIPDDAEKTIFGADNRVTVKKTSAYPFRCIAYMHVYGSCGHSWTGTGFMISKDCLATAAHCVICPDCSKWAKSITFYFGYNGSKNTYYTYNGGWSAWAGDSFSNKKYRIDADCAIVRLSSDVGNRTGWFGTKWNANPSGTKLYVAGYRGGVLKYDRGTASLLGNNHLKYTMDTLPGTSGGPVYDSANYAYAINIAQNSVYNIAYRLNSYARSLWDKVK